MQSVIRNFRPKELWVGLMPPSAALDRVTATAENTGVKIVRHWEGDEFNFGGASVRVLFPPSDWPTRDKPQNNDSLVLRVSYADTAVLLEGDAEKTVERRVAAMEHPRANLLKVGHHGSANATTSELVDAARPEFAIISVGSGNPFGLPRSTRLTGWRQAGQTCIEPTSMERSVSTWTAGLSRLLWRLFNSRNLGRFVVIGYRRAIFGNHLLGQFGILLPNQDDHSSEPRKGILNERCRREVAIDPSRLKKALHHEGFRLLLRTEYFDQLLVRIRTLLRIGGGTRIGHEISHSGFGMTETLQTENFTLIKPFSGSGW